MVRLDELLHRFREVVERDGTGMRGPHGIERVFHRHLLDGFPGMLKRQAFEVGIASDPVCNQCTASGR